LIRLLENSRRRTFTEFKTDQGLEIVLNRQQVEKTQSQIMKTYSVPADRSEDLR
jgi:hypothetical protein